MINCCSSNEQSTTTMVEHKGDCSSRVSLPHRREHRCSFNNCVLLYYSEKTKTSKIKSVFSQCFHEFLHCPLAPCEVCDVYLS